MNSGLSRRWGAGGGVGLADYMLLFHIAIGHTAYDVVN